MGLKGYFVMQGLQSYVQFAGNGLGKKSNREINYDNEQSVFFERDLHRTKLQKLRFLSMVIMAGWLI